MPRKKPDPDAILDELAELAEAIEGVTEELDSLYERRNTLWAEGRTCDPPLLQRELALPSRVTEGAVTQVLRRQRKGAATP